MRLFLRPLKTLIDYAPALINTWPDDLKKQQANVLVQQIKTKHFIDFYNCVKAITQNSGDASAFRTAIIEFNFTLWQLYSSCESVTDQAAVESLTKMFVKTKSLVDNIRNGGAINDEQINQVYVAVVEVPLKQEIVTP